MPINLKQSQVGISHRKWLFTMDAVMQYEYAEAKTATFWQNCLKNNFEIEKYEQKWCYLKLTVISHIRDMWYFNC